jgi:hypothetical protein
MRTAALLAVLALGVAPAAAGASAGPAPSSVELGGSPVPDVSTDPGNPVELDAGLWRDTLGAGSSPQATHQFRYTRRTELSTVHIGVVSSAAGESSDQVQVEASAPDGTTCGSDTSSSSSSYPGAPFGAGLVLQGADEDDFNSSCLRSGSIDFTVAQGSTSSTAELPVAIKIVEEAPLDGEVSSLPAEPDPEPALSVPDPEGDPAPVEGTAAFGDAPLLEDGSYADEGVEGRVRMYRVSLDWGQTLAARVDVPVMAPDQAESTYGFGPQVQLSLLGPTRVPLGSHDDAEPTGSLDDEDAAVLTEATGPVRYRSRYASSAAYLPGDYWVAVSVGTTSDEAPLRFPYTLTVEVQGEVEGTPAYDTDEKPFLVAPDAYSDVASGNPAPSEDEEATPTGRRLAALGLGVFGLVCCALGALQLRRR